MPRSDRLSTAFLRSINLERESVTDLSAYPFTIPAIRLLRTIRFSPRATFFVGENGSGKSTLLEAIAVAMGLNPEGGSRNIQFALRPSESPLHGYLKTVRGTRRARTSYFLRAESFFNVATYVDSNADALAAHGGVSLHEQSHGESFLTLVMKRFYPNGFYILDEPEAALSPQSQLALLLRLHELVMLKGCQVIVATHSPIVLALPDSLIYQLSSEGIRQIEYSDAPQVQLTKDFINNPDAYLARLLKAREDPETADD